MTGKTARRRAREVALQALYAWQLAGGDIRDALAQAREFEAFERCDAVFAAHLIEGVIAQWHALGEHIAPCLAARRLEELSPVERAVLCIGTYELTHDADTPVKVVLNEAIELGRSFGGEAGHRFINGVLERVADAARPGQLARQRQAV